MRDCKKTFVISSGRWWNLQEWDKGPYWSKLPSPSPLLVGICCCLLDLLACTWTEGLLLRCLALPLSCCASDS